MKRNSRVWIAEGNRHVTRMDTAQYGMLTYLHSQEGQPSPSMQVLQLISACSRAQQQSDLEHCVHWSRHLLEYILKVTGAQLLVGASAMTYTLHLLLFVSPNSIERQLDASVTWPPVSALLLLDSFTPSSISVRLRLSSALLHQAAAHAQGVWNQRKTMLKAADPDLSDFASPVCSAMRAARKKPCRAQRLVLEGSSVGYLPSTLKDSAMAHPRGPYPGASHGNHCK
jgi:hypothetical protein